jgi:hypothetical protein
LADQSFLSYFIESLSLNLFVTLYKDTNNDVNFLCDKFAKYEMRLKLGAAKSGKAEANDRQEEKGKGKGKRDMSKVTCYSCNKKGHVISRCPYKKEKKDDNPEEKGKGLKQARVQRLHPGPFAP